MTKNKSKEKFTQETENAKVNTEEKVEEITKNETKEEPVKEQVVNEEPAKEEPEVTITEKSNKEQEYLQMAQKIQAEFENYKKRTLKAEKEAKINGIIDAVSKFLPVIDSFNIAQKQEQNAEYIKANAVIINQLEKALKDLDVEKIEALSKPFDYNLHNAIMVENNPDVENNIVTEVYQEGYRLKDKIIRHSIVKINQK